MKSCKIHHVGWDGEKQKRETNKPANHSRKNKYDKEKSFT